MAGKRDLQMGLSDRSIEAPEVEEALERLMTAKENGTLKALTKARKTIKAVAETYKLEDGERVRCGEFVIIGRSRSGGGIEVPTWEKVVVGGMERAS